MPDITLPDRDTDPRGYVLTVAGQRLYLLGEVDDQTCIIDPRPDIAALAAFETDADYVRADVELWRAVVADWDLAPAVSAAVLAAAAAWIGDAR